MDSSGASNPQHYQPLSHALRPPLAASHSSRPRSPFRHVFNNSHQVHHQQQPEQHTTTDHDAVADSDRHEEEEEEEEEEEVEGAVDHPASNTSGNRTDGQQL